MDKIGPCAQGSQLRVGRRFSVLRPLDFTCAEPWAESLPTPPSASLPRMNAFCVEELIRFQKSLP